MIIIRKNSHFVKADVPERISIIKFLMQKKRVLCLHSKKSFAKYLKSKYAEYYGDYISDKTIHAEIRLFIFITKLKEDGEGSSIKARLYEYSSKDKTLRAIKLFVRPEHPNGLELIIPLREIYSLTLY